MERKFEIVGEAPNQAAKLDPTLQNRITDLRRIVDFRNLLIHGYATVSEEAVWFILVDRLPQLRREVAAILDIAN